MSPLHRLAALLAAALAACASPPSAPPLRAQVSQYAGTVLTGPLGEPATEVVAANALGLRLRVALVDEGLRGEVLPARLIVREGAQDPFVAHSELALGARLDVDGVPRVSQWATHFHEALLSGGTAVLALEPDPAPRGGPRTPWKRLELELSRRSVDSEPLECALALSALEPAALRERILLAGAPEVGGPAWSFAFPAPSETQPELALVVEVQVLPTAGAAALERALARREAARSASEHGAAEDREGERFLLQSGSALQALARRDLQRPALLYLAETTQAELLAELALVLDAQPLADLLLAIRQGLAEQPGELDAAELGWALEQPSWRWLLEQARAEDAETSMPQPLRALLLELAGEAGRWPDLVLDALAQSADARDLTARLERENQIFLEDADPAARVRAWDWLAARGLAPAGFDPLASSAERRAALSALREAASAEGER
jgi:hypothetical protein